MVFKMNSNSSHGNNLSMTDVHAAAARLTTSAQECTSSNGLDMEELTGSLIFQSSEDDSIPFATPPMFVPSVGRGFRHRPEPCDIRIPRTFLGKHRCKNQSLPKKPVGRGSVLKHYSTQSFLGRNPSQNGIQTIETSQQNQSESSPFNENFLGAATRGLTSEILEGKACLMEKFLGKAMTDHETYNPLRTGHQHATHSLPSTHTAPHLNLQNKDQWPEVSSSAAWQSDSGQKGLDFQPRKSLSLQDVLKAMSSSSWEKASSHGSSKKGSGDGSGSGSRKLRRMRKRQVDGPLDDGCEGNMIGGRGESNLAQAARAENGDNRETTCEENLAIPHGSNLIQIECLPDDITEQRLTAVMYCYGPVVSCNIPRDRDTQKGIGIAYVRFETAKACLSAISSLHQEDSPFHDPTNGTEIPKLSLHMVT